MSISSLAYLKGQLGKWDATSFLSNLCTFSTCASSSPWRSVLDRYSNTRNGRKRGIPLIIALSASCRWVCSLCNFASWNHGSITRNKILRELGEWNLNPRKNKDIQGKIKTKEAIKPSLETKPKEIRNVMQQVTEKQSISIREGSGWQLLRITTVTKLVT